MNADVQPHPLLDSMHPCLNVDEIVRAIACELIASGGKKTAVSLASCCKGFEDPVLDALWEGQDRWGILLRSFPEGVRKEDTGFVSIAVVVLFSLPSTSLLGRRSRGSRLEQNGLVSRSTLEGSERSDRIPAFPSHRRSSQCCNIAPSVRHCFRV